MTKEYKNLKCLKIGVTHTGNGTSMEQAAC